MPTTQDILTSLLTVTAELVTWPLLFGLTLLIVLTIGPKLRHAY